MSDFNWLDTQHEQALLTRQQRITGDIEHKMPIGPTDTEWLTHVLGKLMQERIATRNELTRLRAIEQEHLQGQSTLHLSTP
jgi:hypothetical protein